MTSDLRLQTVQEIAYSKWEQAGWPSGDGVEFWLDAEQEFNNRQPSGQSDKIEPDEQPSNVSLSPSPGPQLKLAKKPLPILANGRVSGLLKWGGGL